MSWTVPHNWVTGQPLTSWSLTTQLTDNSNCARQLWHSAVRLNLADGEPQSIPTGETTPLRWDEVTWQSGNGAVWSNSDRGRLLVPVAGWYSHMAAIEWDNASGGTRELGWRFNGQGAIYSLASIEDSNGGRHLKTAGTDIIQATTLDWIETIAFQNSGDDINALDGIDATYCVWRLIAEAS